MTMRTAHCRPAPTAAAIRPRLWMVVTAAVIALGALSAKAAVPEAEPVIILAVPDPAPVTVATVRQYKKKITATPFSLHKPYRTNDIDDMASGFSRELLRRLEGSNQFLTKTSLYGLPVEGGGPSLDHSAVRRLAIINDSQFVISGDIQDSGVSDEGGYLGFFRTRTRSLDIDLFVHDGMTGTLVARRRISQLAEDDVVVGRNKLFASTAFFSTGFGKVVDRMLDSAVELVVSDLDNLPFSARIIKVKDDEIYIDAGATSVLASGDELMVYQVRNDLPLVGPDSNNEVGIPEAAIGKILLTQVQPLFSICRTAAGARNVLPKVGDFVRVDRLGRVSN